MDCVSQKWHPFKWQPYDYNPNGDWRAPFEPNGAVDQTIAVAVFLAFIFAVSFLWVWGTGSLAGNGQ